MILLEWRGSTSGEWISPNGKTYDVGDDTHWEWAVEYLKSNGPNRFKDDPKEELLHRGWMRLVYSANEYLILIETKKGMTSSQKRYMEDQSEETEWLVVDDENNTIYEPFNCITPEDIKMRLGEDHGLGYSHNVSFDITDMERDPLTDPRLNGKINNNFKK